jgi:hypothetical protein
LEVEVEVGRELYNGQSRFWIPACAGITIHYTRFNFAGACAGMTEEEIEPLRREEEEGREKKIEERRGGKV